MTNICVRTDASGVKKYKVNVFPASIECRDVAVNDFYCLYGAMIDRSSATRFQFCRTQHVLFFPSTGGALKDSNYLAMSQSNLVAAAKLNNYSLSERGVIAAQYWDILNRLGIMKAYDYSRELLYSSSHDSGGTPPDRSK